MKLFYCHIPAGNFGDDLNPYLWPRLLPDAFSGTLEYRPKSPRSLENDSPGTPVFVGIGTLIRGDLALGQAKHVLGSGFGYGLPPAQDGSWHYHYVRGPLTAAALGLPPDKAITDPAILVRLFHGGGAEKKHRVSFIPHWEMALSGDWKQVCQRTGINYIDPRWEAEAVIGEIRRSKLLITEALHGSIVADALRVPWIAVSSHHTILRFKWQDWCQSVGLTYAPVTVPAFWEPRPGPWGPLINTSKQLQAAATLTYLCRAGRAVLSQDSVMESRTAQMLDTLARFCRERNFTLNATMPAPNPV